MSPVPHHSHDACLRSQDCTSAHLSAPCIVCCKLHSPLVLNFDDLLSLAFCHCFPVKLKQNDILQFSVYSCLNSETKVCRSSRIINTVFQFGKTALQLFAFFLFLQVFAYCHEVMKFMVLVWNASATCTKTTGLFDYCLQCFLFSPYLL